MKKLFVYIFLILSSVTASAQINEIGIFAGGANYIGDVGPTNYIAPNQLAIGFIYKWNRSPRHSWRFSYTYGELKSNDADSDVPGRYLRGYSFENYIHNFSAGLEFNFFTFDLHDFENQFSPYVFTGLDYFFYDELYYPEAEAQKDYRESGISIPMVVGVKTRLNKRLILGLEVGARYTFTDNLDGSNPKNDELEAFKFGNLNSNDWYVFSGITLTYTFGENPCFCPH